MTEWKSPIEIPSCVGQHVCELLSMIGNNVLETKDIPKLLEVQTKKPCYLYEPDDPEKKPAPLLEGHFTQLVGFKYWNDRYTR